MRVWLTIWLTGIVLGMAGEPLHQRIARLIAAKAGQQKLADPATDTEFLRRAHLDFTGRIPTAADTRKFLTDKSSNKRAKLIDSLFAGPRWAETMAERFHLMLMERRGKDENWQKWLGLQYLKLNKAILKALKTKAFKTYCFK